MTPNLTHNWMSPSIATAMAICVLFEGKQSAGYALDRGRAGFLVGEL
jgi:hypothetical protein